jgi:AcrR family transcriptional regulator
VSGSDRGAPPDPATHDRQAILTPGEAAAHLGISRQTLHRWEQAGRVRRIDPQGPPRYDRAHLDEVAAERGPVRTPEAVRERIVLATAALAAAEGTSACTIDAVAESAGLSRGGVLYHFEHKRDLLAATVTTFLTRFEARWQSIIDALPEDAPQRVTRAYVEATVAPDDDLVAALLVCAVEEPTLLGPVQDRMRRWYRRLDEDGGPEAMTTALAADALWLLPLLGIRPIPRTRQRELLTRLRQGGSA